MIEQRRPKWFSRVQMCEFLDCTPHWFDENLKSKIPAKAVDKSENAFLFHGRTTIEVYCENRLRTSRKVKGILESDDPLDLSVSPMAEKVREERYLILRLNRLEIQRTLISRKKVKETLGRLTVLLREAGERLKRSKDPRAAEILNEALDQFGTEIEALTSRTSPENSNS